jgi:hypothetical protein
LQAQWRNFKDKPPLKSLLSLIAMKVEATPGLVMTQEGPALAQDGFQTAIGEQLSVERTSVRYRYKGERAAYGNVGKPDGGVYNGVIESGIEVTIWNLTEEDYELNPGEVYVRPVSGASNWLRSLKVRFFDLEPL